jgi:hypothetical protein
MYQINISFKIGLFRSLLDRFFHYNKKQHPIQACFIFSKQQDWLDVWKTIMFVIFFFNIRFHVQCINIFYNELYNKLLFSMQILCIGMYIFMYP